MIRKSKYLLEVLGRVLSLLWLLFWLFCGLGLLFLWNENYPKSAVIFLPLYFLFWIGALPIGRKIIEWCAQITIGRLIIAEHKYFFLPPSMSPKPIQELFEEPFSPWIEYTSQRLIRIETVPYLKDLPLDYSSWKIIIKSKRRKSIYGGFDVLLIYSEVFNKTWLRFSFSPVLPFRMLMTSTISQHDVLAPSSKNVFEREIEEVFNVLEFGGQECEERQKFPKYITKNYCYNVDIDYNEPKSEFLNYQMYGFKKKSAKSRYLIALEKKALYYPLELRTLFEGGLVQ